MAKQTLDEELNARMREDIAKINAMMTELYAKFTDAVATDEVVCTTETITITGGIITDVSAND